MLRKSINTYIKSLRITENIHEKFKRKCNCSIKKNEAPTIQKRKYFNTTNFVRNIKKNAAVLCKTQKNTAISVFCLYNQDP